MISQRTENGIAAILARTVAAVAAWGACQTALAATPTDLTGLSLDDLMSLEVPGTASSARFRVSATAVDSCSITATDLAFGNYDSLSAAPADQNASVIVACTADSAYTIGLDAGTGAGATTALRKLTGGAGTLNYSLYRDGARTQVWGNNAGADTVTGIGTGLPAEHTIYGRIPAKQPAKRGTYTDIITVSVTY